MLGIEKFFGGSPGHQGSLAAIAQILQASGPQRMPQSLYSILGGGLMAGQQAAQQAREQEMVGQLRQQQIEEGNLGLANKRRARDEEEQILGAARGSFRTAGQQAASLPGGPTVANASRIGEFKDGFDTETFLSKMDVINPLKALEYRRMLAKASPELQAVDVAMKDGVPVRVLRFKDGTEKVSAFDPQADMVEMNLGSAVKWVDKNRVQPGQEFKRTMTPGEAASNSLGWANHGIAKQRLEIDRTEAATRAAVGKAPTEFQGKSAAFGLRATEADKIITSLTGQYDPAAINSKTSVENWPLVGGALGMATNSLALTANDQKAEQAQRDFVNAVLRQESGAAIGPDEFNNARKQYFPQPGDGPEVIAQKARNRQLAIQGFQSNAGRAAMIAPPVTGNGGWSIQRVD